MQRFELGDYVKVEFTGENAGDSEWMWVIVDSCDDLKQLVFGRLDSQPAVHCEKLKLGQRLVVSYDKVREHKKAAEFSK